MWAKCNVPILAILLSGILLYRLVPETMIAALLISLELIAGAESVYTDIYNFPMLGVLIYDSAKQTNYDLIAYGSVTIVHRNVAVCAVENLIQYDPDQKSYIVDINGRLKVLAGSDILQPPGDYAKQNTQSISVKTVYMGKNSSFVAAIDRNTNWDQLRRTYGGVALVDPPRLTTLPKDAVFNAFVELQWDIAVMILDGEGFKWSPYVLPIPFHWKDNQKLAQQYVDFWGKIEAVEKHPHKFVPCSVPGWSPIGNNEVLYHRVVYVRFKDCAEAICGAYPSSCLNYLNVRQHICFKSLGFADSCVIDQGAPVVCSWTGGSKNPDVLGILVKTFECGTEGLPLVFTRTYAIAAFAKIVLDRDDYDKEEPALLDPNYAEKPV